MKRIVNGVTYNTDTSTVLARCEWTDEDHNGIQTAENEHTLYQTRGGAFFVVEQQTRQVWNERSRETEIKGKMDLTPMSSEEAHKWLMTGDVEVIKNPFDDPPEATAEAEPGATIYIRVPASLKRSVDDAAREARLSGNVWAMRCVERCLDGFPKEIAMIWHIATMIAVAPCDNLEKANDALGTISGLVEKYAKLQFGTDDLAKIPGANLDGSLELEELQRRFPLCV